MSQVSGRALLKQEFCGFREMHANLTANTSDSHTLNALFENATEGILICDSSGKIIRANPSSERLFGYHSGELEGCVVEELVPHRFKNQHRKERENYAATPHNRNMGKGFTLYGKRKDGEEFPLEISLSYFREGEETYAIAFLIDITERRKQEEAILKLNQQLEIKVEERTKVLQEALYEIENSRQHLKDALASQKELNDMKSRFVTMASHEFRTPLSTILSSVSLVDQYNKGPNQEKIGKHVQRIKSAVTNMTLILNDFLSAEKLEAGKVFIRRETVYVEALANEVINDIYGILKKGQVVNYTHVGYEKAFVDRQMLKNIFLNLLSNAIKFSPEDSTITFESRIGPGGLNISVSDTGMGIPPEEQVHLFERFFRAKNAINVQGTGLGLNIVAKYLEAMEGKINFNSELNKGTSFYISIPNTNNEDNSDH